VYRHRLTFNQIFGCVVSAKPIVAIIDDDDGLRKSIVRMLAEGRYEARSFVSACQFLESPESGNVSCVVSDLCMPDVDGFELQRILTDKCPWISIVFITAYGDIPASVTAIKSGAEDFLEKPVKRAALLAAIDRAAERTLSLKTSANELDSLKLHYQRLTPREREVFTLVASGLLNKQIAAELGSALRTIKQHRNRVMLKMEAESLAQLTIMADRLGIRPCGVDFSAAKGRRGKA